MDVPILNLINFEKPFYVGCRYVLTSPRSLRACKEANIKPIELLYKSPEEFANQYGHRVGFDLLFKDYEKERQRKLDLCRSIRAKLIAEDKDVDISATKDVYQCETKEKFTKTSLPPIGEIKNVQREVTRIDEIIDECTSNPILEEDKSDYFNKINIIDLNYDTNKAKVRKKRNIRIYEKPLNIPRRSKSRGPGKIPKISSGIQNYYIPKDVKSNFMDPDYSVHKFQKVIENSVVRDLKHQRAELLQKELEQGFEKWQDRVMVAQWAAISRAEEQAERELEMRMQRLYEKNKIRDIVHKHNINKVKEREDFKVESLRKQVQYKDFKISVLHQEREKVICESRNRAQSVSELRQQVRDLITPETFDRKVTKFNLGRRVHCTPVVCPSFMQTSHIRLG